MNMNRSLKFLCALLGLMLFHSIGSAQTIITGFTNTFPNNGNVGMYPAPSFTYWYSIYQDLPTNYPTHGDYNLTGTNDANMDFTGDTNDSGSMYVNVPWSLYTGSQDQNVFYITFSDIGKFDQSEQMEILIITNISWYIHVDPSSVTNSAGNFGTLSGGLIDTGYGRRDTTFLTIPGSATNGWVLMSETNVADFVAAANASDAADPGAAMAFGVCFNQNSYGTSPNYPENTLIYWIDNVTAQTAAKPPPPPPPPTMSISPVVQGLNLFTDGNSTVNNRESLETIANTYSWVSSSGPVSYSFTITDFPVGPNDAVQCQIFLIPSPSSTTLTAPDYSETNLIFLDLESTATGAQWNFRYKTNQPGGNIMVYQTNLFGQPGTLASIATNTALGTWTVTFNNNTNVTMTIPGGASTNFSIPDTTGATTALFASNVVVYFGAQANNAAAVSDHFVVSDFNITGLGSSDFDDNFVADAGTLNAGIWMADAANATCIQMIGPDNPYWVQWTTPAPSFSLVASPSLSPAAWNPVTANPVFLAGTLQTQLIGTSDLPTNGSEAYFSVVQRAYSQLLVLLPGETNAPNTPTGKGGTPNAVSLTDDGELDVTVQAVDANFYPVTSSTDTIAIADSSGGTATDPSPAAMVSGLVSFDGSTPTGPQPVFFTTTGTFTVTATDTTNTNIPPATSSSFTVGP